MNSYQLKQTARSRRNNAQKVQRPLLKDKAKDRIRIKKIFIVVTTKLLVIMRVVMIMMTWIILLVITEVMRVTMNIVPLNLS